MTGPNIFDALSGGQNIQDLFMMQGVSKSKSSDGDLFSDLLSNIGNKSVTTVSVNETVTLKQETVEYKFDGNKTIKESSGNSVKEKIDASKEELERYESDVIETVAKDLDVSAEDVERVMSELGLSAFDLLNPQNLANLVVELTPATDTAALILDTNFNQLLVDVAELGKNLMTDLQVDINEFTEIIESFDLENNLIDTDVLAATEIDEASVSIVESQAGENVEVLKNTDSVVSQENGEAIITVEDDDITSKVNIMSNQSENADSSDSDSSEKSDSGVETKRPETVNGSDDKFNAVVMNTDNVTESINSQTSVADANLNYISTETMDIINQIAENMKVVIQSDSTTMEMQLNPENLGKVYVSVSSKEGNINAQFTVTSETVREALQAQIVELKENLNQAGVKVDAVEVTIASHEFEKNLEQNHSREEQEGERQEQTINHRRSIRLDSLDELSGLMTEEESLVASIMRDNGNTMDLQA